MKDCPHWLYALIEESSHETDKAMRAIEEQMLKETTADLEKLCPQITDKEAFEQLLVVIREATRKNHTVEEVREKIAVLGIRVKNVIIEAAAMLLRPV